MARHAPARGSSRPSRPGLASKANSKATTKTKAKTKASSKASSKAKAKPKPKPKKRAPAQRDDAPTVLTTAQARFLRGQAHDHKAMLQIGGKGVTEALLTEIDGALEHHELIKVKIAAEDRQARDAIIDGLVKRSFAALVQRIGHVAVLYRPSVEKRRIVLPRN